MYCTIPIPPYSNVLRVSNFVQTEYNTIYYVKVANILFVYLRIRLL